MLQFSCQHNNSRQPDNVITKAEHPVAVAGLQVVRYGLVIVIAWIGALKFTSYEATAIQPLIAHSPLMSWLYPTSSASAGAARGDGGDHRGGAHRGPARMAAHLRRPASLIAVLLFLSTLSLLFTTPGVTAARGFPVLSVLPGQFLLKDLVLIGASLWTLGESLGAAKSPYSWQPILQGGSAPVARAGGSRCRTGHGRKSGGRMRARRCGG